MANAASDDELFEDLRPDPDEGAPGNGKAASADAEATDTLDAGDPLFDDLNIGLDAAMGTPEDEIDPLAGTDATPPEDEQVAAPSDAEEDISGYSERVQKRILRERRLKSQERERRELAESQVAELSAKIDELSGKFSQIERAGAQSTVQKQLAEAKGKVDAARAKYRQARIDGDLDAELAAQDEVNELDFQRRLLEARAQQIEAAGATERPAPVAKPAAAAAPKATPATQAWLNRNASWWGKDAVLTAAAKAIDAEIAGEGLSSADPAYFAELDRRMAAKGLRKPGATASQHKGPVAPANARGGPTQRASNSVHLTKADMAAMRSFRLDPSNPQHIKQYAIEKRAASRSE